MKRDITGGSRRLVVVAAFAAAAVTASGYAALARDTATGRTARADRFWNALRLEAREVEHHPTLAGLTAAADSVVRGRLSGIRLGRVVSGDAVEDHVAYAEATLTVTEHLTGAPVTATVPLEFLLLGPDPAGVVRGLAASLPEGEVVAFLHAKRGAREAGRYRLVNSSGLWAASGRAALDTPLADAPAARELYAAELAGVDSLAELSALLRSA